jgi:hypothetical protein
MLLPSSRHARPRPLIPCRRSTALRAPLLLALLLSAFTTWAQQSATVYDASRYVLVDAKLLRGHIGYSTFRIGQVDTMPDRAAHGLAQRIEARIISGFVKRDEGFVVADAFFLDLTLGSMTSDPEAYYKDPESRFSLFMRFGYSFMAGYSHKNFGILVGKSFNWSAAMVGSTSLPGQELLSPTGPWMMRLELRPAFSKEFRLMLTGWDNFTDVRRDKGFRVDVPFLPGRRLYLTYQFDHLAGDVSYVTLDNGRPANGVLTQHLFGLRFGSIY